MYRGSFRKGGGSVSLCNKIQGRRALRRKALLALSATAGMAALAGQAFGQTNDSWLGGGANGTWGTSGNWTPSTPGTPGGGTVNDTATFNAAGSFSTVILDSTGDNLESIVFGSSAAAFTIGATSGPSLGLTNGGSISNGTENETAAEIFNAPIVLEGTSYTFTGSSSNNTESAGPTGILTFNGGISGTTATTVLTLTNAGTSTVAAIGANVINGIISNGTASSLGLLVSGGTWDLSGPNTFTGGASLTAGALLNFTAPALGSSGTITLAGGTLQWATGNTQDVSSRLTALSGTSVIDVNGNSVSFAHPIGGTGSIEFTSTASSGALNLTTYNTYSGGTTLGVISIYTAGIAPTQSSVSINNNGAFGTGALWWNSGTLTGTGATPLNLANTFYDNDSNDLVYTGTESLTFSGTTYDANGLQPYAARGITNNATNGATVTYNNVQINGPTRNGLRFVISGTGVNAVNGVISDGAGTSDTLWIVAAPGAGVTYINGSNTYSGGTALGVGSTPSGQLILATSNAFGSGAGTVNMNGTNFQSAAPITLANNFVWNTTLSSGLDNIIGAQSGPITITGNFTDTDTSTGNTFGFWNDSNATLTLAGNVPLGNLTAVGLQFGAGNPDGGVGQIVITGVLSDGSVYPACLKTDNPNGAQAPGILYVQNPSNTYSGGTLVSGFYNTGTTLEFVNGALGTGALAVAGATLQWAPGNSQDVSAMLAASATGFVGAQGLASPGADLDTNGNNVTFNTAISATGALIKIGAGTLTLAASGNNTNSSLDVEGGTLAIGGSASITTSSSLNLGSGTLYFNAGASGVTFTDFIAGDEVFDWIGQYAAPCVGAGAIVAAPNYSNTVALGSLYGRDPGNTVDFTLPTTGGGSITTTAANPNFPGGQPTILGGWATVDNGSTWASVSGGKIVGLTSFSTSFTATTDVDAPTGTSTPGTLAINSLRFNNVGAYTVADSGAGNTLTIATGGILETAAVGANAVAINAKYLTSANDYGYNGYFPVADGAGPVAISDLILNQFNTSAAMTISSIIENNASTGYAVGLTKTGPGTVVLTGANTYTGVTNINMGTLEVGSGGDIAGSAINIQGGVLTVDSGASLASTTQLQVGSLINVQGGTVNAPGVANFNNAAQTLAVLYSNGTVNLNGTALTLTSVPTSYTSGNYSSYQYGGFYGNINGTGSLIINETTSTSTMNLFGGVIGAALASTYSGGTTITSGVLSFSNIDELGAAAITLNGGANSTLQWHGTNVDVSGLGVNLTASGGNLDTNGMNVTLANGIGGGGAGSLTKIGIGTLYLNGANTWTGATNVTVGTLELQSGTLASTNVTVNVANATAGNTILNVDAGASLNSATALTDNNFVNFNNASQTIATLNGANTGVVNLNGNGTTGTALTVTNGDNGTPLAAAIEGIGGLTLSGGTLTVNNDNDYYSGGTTLNGGILNFNSASALISPMYSIGTGGITFNGGTLQWGASNTADISTRTVTLNIAGGTLDINGNNVALANPIGNSGAGGLTLIDSGSAATLTLNGANAYSGGTTVSSGTLIANVNNALPTNKAVVNNSVLVVNGNNAVGAITGPGKLTVGTSSANTLQIAANSAQSSQTSITVAAGSTLDITNNSIVLTPTAGTQATELAYYLGLVKQGYNSGSWTGTGITSSAVAAANAVTPLYGIAVAENDGSYGTVVGLGSGQIEVAEAVIGDATLSGTVNFADFVKVEGNYGLTGADWDEGDFFYTGTVNFADFVAVEANFGDTNAISAPEMAAMQSFAGTFGDTLVANSDGVGFQVVAVPEPASLGLLALAGVGLLARRRRRTAIAPA